MKKVLMVVGHPYWPDSFANKAIVKEFTRLCPDAEIRNLYELYPDNKIDVHAEQKALAAADVIILQFPIMWYSCPSLLHRWMEEVLTFGFAYGPGGDALHGKKYMVSFTTAGTADKYSKYGAQGCTIDELAVQFAALSTLCGLEFVDYTYSGGMLVYPDAPASVAALVEDNAKAHAQRLFMKI